MRDAVDTFKNGFNQLSAESLHLVEDIYAPDIHFIDPIHEIKGIEPLKKYFANLYDGVVYCQFDFAPEIRGEAEATIPWVMNLEHGTFQKGKRVAVPGISHIRFEDKVIYHRDYFDLGKLIYERVPVLGAVIRKIKARL